MNLTKGVHQSENFRLSTAQVRPHRICTLMASFCWKYIKFQLKKYRGVMCYDTVQWWKIWRGIGSSFQNWHKAFDKSYLEHSKVSKIYMWMGCFWLKYILFELKEYRRLSFITLNSDAKFEEKLTCGLENNMRNFANFHQSTWVMRSYVW